MFPAVNVMRALCYIFLLHQTTTRERSPSKERKLCYIFLLHQTTTGLVSTTLPKRCVISFFYIKPQQIAKAALSCYVVLYLSSTSNHNFGYTPRYAEYVVLYLSSTSNHNVPLNIQDIIKLCYIFLLHQTTTV